MTSEKEHRELHDKIWNCPCLPDLVGADYCLECQKNVLNFLNKYGAGELTNDSLLDILQAGIQRKDKEIILLRAKLEQKIKDYDKLKKAVKE